MSAADPGRGTSADELNALLTTLTQWAQRAMPAPPSGRAGPECQWCPLCQLASALRGEHPELTDRLAEAGAAVADAVRALTESAPFPASWPATVFGQATDGGSGTGESAAPDSGRSPAETPAPRTRPRPRPRTEPDDPPGSG